MPFNGIQSPGNGIGTDFFFIDSTFTQLNRQFIVVKNSITLVISGFNNQQIKCIGTQINYSNSHFFRNESAKLLTPLKYRFLPEKKTVFPNTQTV